jgi:hypothetical protein
LVGVGGGVISGGTISGTTFTNGSTFNVSSTGVLTAQSGTIGGTSMTSTTLTGGIIQTSTGSNAIILDGSSNALQFKAGGSVVTNMLNFGSSGALWHYGSTPNSAGSSYPLVKITSSSSSIDGSSTQYFSAGATGNLIGGSTIASGDWTFNGTLLSISANADFTGTTYTFPNITSSTSAANVRWGTTTNGRLFYVTSSSQRFKENIVDINTVAELQPSKLLDLPIRAFKYKDDHLDISDQRSGVMVPGFIAEEMSEIYPIATDYEDELPNNWNEKFLIPGMLALIQDLYKEIKTLKGE